MIYLFYGDDVVNKIFAYEKFLSSIPKGEEVFYIYRNNFDRAQIESFYSGAGLFFPRCTVVLSGIWEREETRAFALEKLGAMVESVNSFVFLEGKLDKKTLDAFKKALPVGRQGVPSINFFELPKEKKEKYNNFLVANAFGARDKFGMWLHFRRAMDLGVGMEEIVGVLFWKIKDMILKRDFHKFSEAELKNTATKLSYLLPKARNQGRDAEASFEQFLLRAF